jgi:DNA-binding GntR family transcriptional regulator
MGRPPGSGARYTEVAEALQGRIESGEIPSGSLLPSEAALCTEFEISRSTARRAFQQLEDLGLVVAAAGRGRLVAETQGETPSWPRLSRRRTARFREVADVLEQRIASGELAPGEQLPSFHTVATEFGLTRATAQQAVKVLVERGLVEARPGVGVFVRPQR